MENFQTLLLDHHRRQFRIPLFLRSLHRKPYLVFLTLLLMMCDYHSQIQMRVLKQRGVENLPNVIKPVNGRAGIKTRADWHRVQVLKHIPKLSQETNELMNIWE